MVRWHIIWKVGITIVSIVVATLLIGATFLGISYLYIIREGIGGEEIEVTIPKGSTAKNVGTILKEKGLIPHEWFFLASIRLFGGDKNIKYGVYVIPRGYSPKQILELIKKGPKRPIYAYKITVPEGLTNWQIAYLTPEPEIFLSLVNSPSFAQEMNIPGPTVEGFLMPGTYFFEEMPDSRQIAETMIREFEKEWKKLELEANKQFDPKKRYEIVTIASLVEEEAKVNEERPLIAQVIYNRLAKGMPLQIDATLQYATRKYGDPLTNKDKMVDSPYNTYKINGLPPTPICNPGLLSIRSALFPAEGDYLYFVSNADGKTHTFSKTLGEHNTAVLQYRTRIKKR